MTEHPNATPTTPATRIIKYTYDAADRLVRRTDDTNADQTPEIVAKYVYDGDDLALELNGSNAMTHRYLWNSAVDEILADEKIGDQVIWPLADHEGTVRDLVSSSGTVLNHRKYDSFGKITAESNPAVDHLFAYTGQILDEATGLQNHLHRWYNPALGRWISEDPASFSAGDANLYRYCGNSPTNYVDSSGLFLDLLIGAVAGMLGDSMGFGFSFGFGWGGGSDSGSSDWGMDSGWGDWSSDMSLYSDISWPLDVSWGGMDTGWGGMEFGGDALGLGSDHWGTGQGALVQAMNTGWGGVDTSWGAMNPEITRQMQAQTPGFSIPLGTTAPATPPATLNPSALQSASMFEYSWNVGTAFAGGLGQGACNIVGGLVAMGTEMGYMAQDLYKDSVGLITGHDPYWGYRSQVGQALYGGQLGYGQYYAETGANAVTFGTYGQGKALYQYSTGQITADQASQQVGTTAVMQLAGAHVMKTQGIGTQPIRLPSFRAGTKPVWQGPRIRSGVGQSSLRDANVVEQIKNDMLNGRYRYSEPKGRIGGWRDSAGEYYIGEGHHRMEAAMQAFEKTGNPSYVNQLLKNGLWRSGKPSAVNIKPLPRRYR